MCAIIDSNIVHEIFGESRPEAGKKFLNWIESGKVQLVVGGTLFQELKGASQNFRKWTKSAFSTGKIILENGERVMEREKELQETKVCSSNDLHIIALAQLSGARLLYSNDKKLQQDFKNRQLINNPRGKIYSTNDGREAFSSGHKNLLSRRDLCQSQL